MRKEIEIPSGIEAKMEGTTLVLKGKRGTSKKLFDNPFVSVKLNGSKVTLESKNDKRKSKRVVNTFAAHLTNMVTGVTKGYSYKLQVAQTHFPVKIAHKGDKVIIENFVGEKDTREVEIRPGVKVEIKGKEIFLSGADKDDVGNAASGLEMATRIRHKDRRTFQDGIFIIKKGMTIDD